MVSKTREDISNLSWDDAAQDVMEVYQSLGL
jgi:hypothetical protein